MSTAPVGSVIELVGLEKSKDFNGRRALIECWEEGYSRVQVRLLQPGTGIAEMRSVKASNVIIIEEAGR